MQFMTQFASGLVLIENPETQEWSPGGSCAAYLGRSAWLTASHCVPGGHRLVLLRHGLFKHELVVSEVHRHPDLDLAMIRVSLVGDTAPSGLEDHFLAQPANKLLEGGDFIGFGYPIDAIDPIGRLLKGHFQRYFSYSPPHGKPYFAGEMSVPAPGGFSGAVLSYAHDLKAAAAIVTSNWETSTTVDSYEEVQDGGNVYKETIKRVVTYGIAMMLTSHVDWLTAAAE